MGRWADGSKRNPFVAVDNGAVVDRKVVRKVRRGWRELGGDKQTRYFVVGGDVGCTQSTQ